MSESNDTQPLVAMVVITLFVVFCLILWSHSQVRDLQRRVAELEQKK